MTTPDYRDAFDRQNAVPVDHARRAEDEADRNSSRPCSHTLCGTHTACCKPDCPIVMVTSGEITGRWEWLDRSVYETAFGRV